MKTLLRSAVSVALVSTVCLGAVREFKKGRGQELADAWNSGNAETIERVVCAPPTPGKQNFEEGDDNEKKVIVTHLFRAIKGKDRKVSECAVHAMSSVLNSLRKNLTQPPLDAFFRDELLPFYIAQLKTPPKDQIFGVIVYLEPLKFAYGEKMVPAANLAIENWLKGATKLSERELKDHVSEITGTVMLLDSIGPPAVSSLPLLQKVVALPHEPLRDFAIRAQISIRGATNIPPQELMALLQKYHSFPAAEALQAHGMRAKSVADSLGKFLVEIGPTGRQNEMVIKTGYVAYAAIGENNPAVFQFLLKGAASQDSLIKQAALQALGTYRPINPQSFPVLVAALGDANPSVAGYAANSLRRMGPEAKGALPMVEKLIADSQTNPRNKEVAMSVKRFIQK